MINIILPDSKACHPIVKSRDKHQLKIFINCNNMKILKGILLVGVFFIIYSKAAAQSVSVQNQFFVNPYVYNPAFAGNEQVSSITASVKKQWLGLEGSPTLASLTYEKPVTEKFNVAGMVTNLTEGPFNNLNAFATGSYGVQLSKAHNQMLYFGLSLGFRWSFVDMGKFDDPDDQALSKYDGSEFLMDAAFGFKYTFDQFTIGASSPRISRSSWFVNNVNEGSGYDPFERMIFSASYTYSTQRAKIDLTPHLIYHVDTFSNQLEGMLIVDYDQKLSLGAGFRENYGSNFMAGFQLKTGLSFNYFFTLSSANSALPQDSHELVFSYLISK